MAISRFSTSSVAQGLPKYQKVWDGTSVISNVGQLVYESIATATPGGSGSVTFSSIPQNYKNLQIIYSMSTNRGVGGATGSGRINFNSDSVATNYHTHSFYGDGSTTAVYAANENDGIWWYGDTTVFVPAVIDIADYTNSNKYKTVKSLTGFDKNGSGYMSMTSLLWKNTAAITSITLEVASAGFLYGANTHISLYGIKG